MPYCIEVEHSPVLRKTRFRLRDWNGEMIFEHVLRQDDYEPGDYLLGVWTQAAWESPSADSHRYFQRAGDWRSRIRILSFVVDGVAPAEVVPEILSMAQRQGLLIALDPDGADYDLAVTAFLEEARGTWSDKAGLRCDVLLHAADAAVRGAPERLTEVVDRLLDEQAEHVSEALSYWSDRLRRPTLDALAAAFAARAEPPVAGDKRTRALRALHRLHEEQSPLTSAGDLFDLGAPSHAFEGLRRADAQGLATKEIVELGAHGLDPSQLQDAQNDQHRPWTRKLAEWLLELLDRPGVNEVPLTRATIQGYAGRLHDAVGTVLDLGDAAASGDERKLLRQLIRLSSGRAADDPSAHGQEHLRCLADYGAAAASWSEEELAARLLERAAKLRQRLEALGLTTPAPGQ